jgi:hypothetical protein
MLKGGAIVRLFACPEQSLLFQWHAELSVDLDLELLDRAFVADSEPEFATECVNTDYYLSGSALTCKKAPERAATEDERCNN